MKKLFIIALVAVYSISSFAGTNDVKSKTSNHFNVAHADAKNVSWKVSPLYTEASFIENGQVLSVFYNVEGEFVGTKRHLNIDDLPLAASGAIKDRFSDYSIVEVAEFINADNEWAYYATVENQKLTRVISVSPYGDITTLKKIKK